MYVLWQLGHDRVTGISKFMNRFVFAQFKGNMAVTAMLSLNWANTNLFINLLMPVCHNIANGIKPGSNSKTTDKHAVQCSKAVCWGVK